MKVFAEHDGCVSIHEALQPFRRSYEGKLEAALRRVVTDALAKAKLPIREAIARHLRVDLEDVPNPIPPSDQSWQSKIQIGYAVRDDDNHWMFKLKSEL